VPNLTTEENYMRHRLLLLTPALALCGLLAPAASQASANTLSIKAKITKFYAHGSSLNAGGVIAGTLKSGGQVQKDTAPVKFKVAAASKAGRCNILTLNLQQLHLNLLGARRHERDQPRAVRDARQDPRQPLLRGQPREDRAAWGRRRDDPPAPGPVAAGAGGAFDDRAGRPDSGLLPGARPRPRPAAPRSARPQRDLYGKTKSDPVEVMIPAQPGQGLLGDLLCSLAGSGGINTLSMLQSVLHSLGVNVGDADLQNLLGSLGINLANGLTGPDLQRILQSLQPSG
jgi:hypothetical protein